MSFTFTNRSAAEAFAKEARALHKGTDWEVWIENPLFEGDAYTVRIG